MTINTYEELKAVLTANTTKIKNIFNSIENGFAILQPNDNAEYTFLGYDSALKCGGPKENDYYYVWTESVKDNSVFTDINSYLEDIFTCFNCGTRPENYYGTSLSVSNIVLIKNNGVVTAYYVDMFGFKTVDNFI